MNIQSSKSARTHANEDPQRQSRYDYSNTGRPRDFDIRIEVAEQQEIAKQSQKQFSARMLFNEGDR